MTNISSSLNEATTLYVGIDMHVKTWYITTIKNNQIKQFVQEPDYKSLHKYLTKRHPDCKYIVGYEAGCFGFALYRDLTSLGVEVHVLNPADIPTSDKDKRSKTDKSDSKKIALSLKSDMVKSIYVPDDNIEEIRALSRRRTDLIKKSTRVKNQIKAMLKRLGILFPKEIENYRTHWTKRFIAWLANIKFNKVESQYTMDSYLKELDFLKQEIKLLFNRIKVSIQKSDLSKMDKILQSVPGIGEISSMTIISEIFNIKRFKTSDRFVSYVGLAPTEHSSGEKKHKGHLNRRCNARLRTVFIEAAWVAIGKDKSLSSYYEELKHNIGAVKSIVKVARKLACRVRRLLLTEEYYKYGI